MKTLRPYKDLQQDFKFKHCKVMSLGKIIVHKV